MFYSFNRSMQALHCCPDNQSPYRSLLGICIRRIDRLKAFGIEKFLHDCIDSLSNQRFDDAHYEEIDQRQLKPVVESFEYFVQQVVQLELSKEKVLEDLSNLNVSDESSNIIWDIIDARRYEVNKSLQSKAIIHSRYLIDFDWKVHVCLAEVKGLERMGWKDQKLSLASDSKSLIRKPHLLLSLKIGSPDHSNDKEIFIELTKDELNDFIQSLEELGQQISILKT